MSVIGDPRAIGRVLDTMQRAVVVDESVGETFRSCLANDPDRGDKQVGPEAADEPLVREDIGPAPRAP